MLFYEINVGYPFLLQTTGMNFMKFLVQYRHANDIFKQGRRSEKRLVCILLQLNFRKT